MILSLIIAALVGYLLGSFPSGFLVARSKGINIFEHGSRNPGATNVRRVLGHGPGNLVFFLDALKGALASSWALMAYANGTVSYDLDNVGAGLIEGSAWVRLGVVGLIGALLGHSFSCFTRFRGGKGVATSVGGLLVLMPLPLVIGAAIWAATFYTTRYVSVASILAGVSLPVSAFFLHRVPILRWLAVIVACFIILRHRANLKRLMNGTENRFVKKRGDAPTP